MSKFVNVVLSGGSGTRLFPLSRNLMPKQFLKLFNNSSFFQQTIKRNSQVCDEFFVVCNEAHYFLAQDELENLPETANKASFLLEPIGRNTAPAIALACFSLKPEDILLVTPSDHLIEKESEYVAAVRCAKELALDGFLVTFGIKPEFPETGFGYIEAHGESVLSFKEKPDLESAKSYIQKGNFFWNSGMFCFKAGAFLDELQKHSPKVYESSKLAFEAAKKGEAIRVKPDDMQRIPEDSIDYAVMEKSDRIKVVSCDIGWSDIGSFDAIYTRSKKDLDGNVMPHNSFQSGSKGSMLFSNRFVALIDVEDLIVVDTDDALVVCKKESSQKIKDVVKHIKSSAQNLHETHTTVHRPWGTYTILEESGNYKIKKIVVKPKKRLSLQKHHHRSEHWIVVSGSAKVTLEDNEYIVNANESTYIPTGKKHRLENPGLIPLVIIEAQVGEYLGEDDIVRFDDDFKRGEA